MKKIILTLAATAMMFSAYSQKLRDAQKSISEAQANLIVQSTGEAIKHINEAKTVLEVLEQDPKMQQDFKFWLAKAQAYSIMSEIPDFAAQNPHEVYSDAIDKALALDMKKTINASGAKTLIINNGFSHFNNGVNAMNASKFAEATHSFEEAHKYLNLDGGKLVKGSPQAEDILAKSIFMGGTSAYYAEDYNKAVKYLEMASKNPSTAKESNVYLNLANAYGKLNQRDKQLATIQAGKKLFAEDANIFAAEINYYIDVGETDKVISGLKDQIKTTPTRDDYHYNLGLTYMELVKRDAGKETELNHLINAREAFKQARQLKPENHNYSYYEGTALFNAAALTQEKAISTKDAAEREKFLSDKEKFFNDAVPLFQAVHKHYKSQDKSKLQNTDLAKWEQSLRALSRIYAEFNQTENYDAIQRELRDL